MFRSSTIIREFALNLAKVIFKLKHSVKLGRYLLCGCVAASCSMLPHNRIMVLTYILNIYKLKFQLINVKISTFTMPTVCFSSLVLVTP